MLENRDYVSSEIAKLLKEKGFNEPCEKCIDINTKRTKYCDYDHICVSNDALSSELISYPTLYEVIKWLREKHNIYIFPTPYLSKDIDETSKYIVEIYKFEDEEWRHTNYLYKFVTYEEALNAGILEALNTI